MAKRRKNQTDVTLRNNRATAKRLTLLTAQIRLLQLKVQALSVRVLDIEHFAGRNGKSVQ